MKIKRIPTLLIAVFTVLSLSISSCAKDGAQGPVGPIGAEGPPGKNASTGSGSAGPQGPQGPGGQDGRDGQDGQDGRDGNANVRAYTFTLSDSDYTVHSDGNFYMHRDTLLIGDIDAAVLDSGTVQLFTKGTTANNWIAMPYYRNGQAYNYAVGIGEIPIEISYNDTGAVVLPSADYKAVVIPSASILLGIDYNNFEELKSAYGFQ